MPQSRSYAARVSTLHLGGPWRRNPEIRNLEVHLDQLPRFLLREGDKPNLPDVNKSFLEKKREVPGFYGEKRIREIRGGDKP